MIRDRLHNAITQDNLSHMRPGSTVEPDPKTGPIANKRKWPLILLAAISICAVGLLVYSVVQDLRALPQTTTFGFQTYGIKLSETGEFLDEGIVNIQGTYYHYPAGNKSSKLHIKEFELPGTDPDLPFYLFFRESVYKDRIIVSGGPISQLIRIEFSTDGTWCVIQQGDRYIICSKIENFDVQSVIDRSSIVPSNFAVNES